MLFSIYVDYIDREYLERFCDIKHNDTIDSAAHKLVEIIRENRRELTRLNDLKNS